MAPDFYSSYSFINVRKPDSKIVFGNNSVIANGAVVASSVPQNVVASGVSYRVLKQLNG